MSRFSQVFEVYKREGPTKAMEFGRTLGLAEVTVKSYIWKFGKGLISSCTKRSKSTINKVRVVVTYAPGKVAYMVTEGKQVSVILWQYNGLEQCLSNRFIIPYEQKVERIRLD